jgi:hypothetical protein
MVTIVRISALLLLYFGFFNWASAAEVSWSAVQSMQDYSQPTALAACEYYGKHTYMHPTMMYKSGDVTYNTLTEAICVITVSMGPKPEGGEYVTRLVNNSTWIVRYGSTCPDGSEIGPTDTECPLQTQKIGDKCEDQAGQNLSNPKIWDGSACTPFLQATGDAPCAYIKSIGDKNPGYVGAAYTVEGQIDAAGNAVAPPSFADDALSCGLQTVSSSECTLNVKGAVSCNVVGKLTGKASKSGKADVRLASCGEAKKPCPEREPKVSTKEEPCTPVANKKGGTTCTVVKETTSEGKQQCGLVNGAYKCITRAPRSNGLTTGISSTSKTLPGGDIETTTVKKSANTVCTDVNTCTTQNSQTTTKAVTSPSGRTTTTSSCTGTCTADGGGVETLPYAGTGKIGKGAGGEGGEEGSGTASTTSDCDVLPPCEGDPFLCAVLKQAHIDTCKLMAGPTPEEQAAQEAKTAAAYAALDVHQSELDAQANSLLGQFKGSTSGGGPGGGKCLPDIPFTAMGHTMVMEFSKTCDSISFIRYAVLAAAYLFAARIVFREV